MKETTDVWLMAFLVLKGYEIKSYSVIARGKIKAQFEIEDSLWRTLKLEFQKSDVSKLKSTIDQIKDLAW